MNCLFQETEKKDVETKNCIVLHPNLHIVHDCPHSNISIKSLAGHFVSALIEKVWLNDGVWQNRKQNSIRIVHRMYRSYCEKKKKLLNLISSISKFKMTISTENYLFIGFSAVNFWRNLPCLRMHITYSIKSEVTGWSKEFHKSQIENQ